ncbi:hypothetical protein JCM8202_005661 [Rhodotorula sphaerocarpa]
MSAVKGKHTPAAQSGSTSDSDGGEFDPVSFQAELDASVNSSRTLVDSWLPHDLGAEWNNPHAAQRGDAAVQGLKDRARPPRLGLGAQPAAAHKQLAEDRKIKNRLLGKHRASLGDEGSVVKSLNAESSRAGGAGGGSSEDDEEDSRAGAIGKGKGKAAALQGTRKDYANPFVIPKPGAATPSKSNVHAAANLGGKALFNDPSPVKPAPASSAGAASSERKSLVAASAFYGDSSAAASADKSATNGTAGPNGSLTKNQRKKERLREKAAALKRQREEESRQEEEIERRKRSRVEGDGNEGADDDAVAGTGRPEAGSGQANGDDEAASADEAMAEGIEAASEPPSPTKAGDAGGASPSKRRKKKKKAGANGAGTAAGPLLNL